MVNTNNETKRAYTAVLEGLKESMPLDEAMTLIGGGDGGSFDKIGQKQLAVLRHFGLEPHHHLIEVGCGAGRLAKPMSKYLTGKYSGFDIIDENVDYAQKLVQRPDWTFESIDYISIPEPDGCADMVCFFSVFTHLLNEESYVYLEECVRVLKPGGRIHFTFMEFREESQWRPFLGLVEGAKEFANSPISMFTHRDTIEFWAKHLRLKIEEIRSGSDPIFGFCCGSSQCLMSTPLTK